MKKFSLIIAIFYIVGIYAKERHAPVDNLYLNIGAGVLIGDNGQPSSISNIATAWDMNFGYWFGDSKYGGLRIGYTGDVLHSFNYTGRKAYGWNVLYVDGMLNMSNLIQKTKISQKDSRWYCSPFLSIECLIPMAQNQHKTSLGIGLGVANEVNVHKNISVTLDWRNTLAITEGIKWLPEVNAGLKFYFNGNARYKKKEEISKNNSTGTIIIHDCKKQNDSIRDLKSQLATLNERMAVIGSDTSIYHLEDKVIRDYMIYSCKFPYNYPPVNRAIELYPKISEEKMRRDYKEFYDQLLSYYEYTKDLLDILKEYQKQLSSNSPTFNQKRWKESLKTSIDDKFPIRDKKRPKISRLDNLNDVIDKIIKESQREKPDLTNYIEELQKAINTKK